MSKKKRLFGGKKRTGALKSWARKMTAACLLAAVLAGTFGLPSWAGKSSGEERPEEKYEVTTSVKGDGRLFLHGSHFFENEEVLFYAKAGEGKKLCGLDCENSEDSKQKVMLIQVDKEEEGYSFAMPAHPVRLSAVFGATDKESAKDAQDVADSGKDAIGNDNSDADGGTAENAGSPGNGGDGTDTDNKHANGNGANAGKDGADANGNEANAGEDGADASGNEADTDEKEANANGSEADKSPSGSDGTVSGENDEDTGEDAKEDGEIKIEEGSERGSVKSEDVSKEQGDGRSPKKAARAKGDIGVKQILDYPLGSSGNSYLNYESPITGDKMRVSLHRTADNEVAYCLNRTKSSDKDDYNWNYDIVSNKDTKYTDLQRNILLCGYPGNSVGKLEQMYGFGVSARAAEQATQLAIWIGNYLIENSVGVDSAWSSHSPYNTGSDKAAQLSKAILARAHDMLGQKLTAKGSEAKVQGENATMLFTLTAKAQYYPIKGKISGIPTEAKVSGSGGISIKADGSFSLEKTEGTATVSIAFSKYAKAFQAELTAKGSIPIPPSYGGILYYDNRDGDYQSVVHVKEVRPFYSEKTASIKWKPEPWGRLSLIKTSEDGKTAGFTFNLSGPNQYSKDFTTDTKGKIDFGVLSPGTYTITEKVDSRYVTPKTQTVTLKDGDDKSVSFHNVLRKMVISLEKRDSKNGDVARGDGSLAGAEYAIYDAGGKEVDKMVTGINHKARSKQLPMGVYTVKETKPSPGYELDPTVYTVDGTKGDSNLEVTTWDIVSKEDVIEGKIRVIKILENPDSQSEEVIPAKGVRFTYTLNSNPAYSMSFTLDENGTGESGLVPYGTYTLKEDLVPKGWKAIMPKTIKIEQPDQLLTYYLKDPIDGTECKIIKKDKETGKQIAFAGTRFQIRKKETGEVVSLNITYPVKEKISEFTTNKEGFLMLPEKLQAGNYLLYELQAPEGYVKEKEPLPFSVPQNANDLIEIVMENTPQRIELAVHKFGPTFSKAESQAFTDEEKTALEEGGKDDLLKVGGLVLPVFEEQPLEGVSYELTAMEDIVTLDGTVRMKKGEKKEEKTDKDGKAVFHGLYPGYYELKETGTLEGYIADKEGKEVRLVYGDSSVLVEQETLTFLNRQQTPELLFQKTLEENSYLSLEKPWEKVLFGLYAGEDLKKQLPDGAQGEVLIPKGSLMDFYRIGESGEAISQYKTRFPYGTYYIEEITTHPAYVLDQKQYSFSFHFDGQDEEKREILAVKEPIVNKPSTGGLELTKQEVSTGRPVPNCGVEIKNEAGKSVVRGMTDAQGKIIFEQLPAGKYTYREYEAPKGYLLKEDEYPFEIKEDGEIIKAVMENDYTKVKVSKQDITTRKELPGARLILKKDNGDLIEEWVSGNSPHLIERLEPGWYELEEITAPEGYEKAEDIRFEVTAKGEVQQVAMFDEPLPTPPEEEMHEEPEELPEEEEESEETKETQKETEKSRGSKTGDDNPVELFAALMVLSFMGIGGSLYKKRQNKK